MEKKRHKLKKELYHLDIASRISETLTKET